MRVRLISRDNGVGLSADVAILTDILTSHGHQVSFSDWQAVTSVSTDHTDLNIHLELLNPMWFPRADRNIGIFNPEWFEGGWKRYLRDLDMVLAKSKDHIRPFKRFQPNTFYLGFTSRDRYLPEVSHTGSWLHLQGQSSAKGTNELLQAWRANPDFPTVTVVRSPGSPSPPIKNVRYVNEYLPEEDLVQLMNECPVHLCPSKVEGYGHYIGEAMSCGALVITTNGRPMSEIVTSQRGILIDCPRKHVDGMAYVHHVTADNIARAVRHALALSVDQVSDLQANAREWFVKNKAEFAKRFISMVEQVGGRVHA